MGQAQEGEHRLLGDMQKEVRFSGLNTATNGRLVADGAMGDMMNLMPGADGLSIVTFPQRVDHGEGNELMCIHHLPDGGVNYIYRRIEVEQPLPIEGGTPTEGGNDSVVGGDEAVGGGDSAGGEESAGTNKCLVIWKTEPTGTPTTLMQTSSVITNQLELLQGIDVLGNTLIMRWSKRIVYALWRSDTATYESLGEKPPMTQIQFGLRGTFASYPDYKDKSKNLLAPDGWRQYPNEAYGNGGTSHIDEGDWIVWNETFYKASFPCDWTGYKKRVPYTGGSFSAESMFTMAANNDFNDNSDTANGDSTTTIVMRLTNLIMGAVNKFVAQQGSDRNRFIMPFLVRYAYRMFDNTHIMHSVPVLQMPNSKAPVVWWRGDSSIQERHSSDKSYSRREPYVYARVSANSAKLMMRKVDIPADLWKWRDVIQGIDIYVSQPLYTYEQDKPVFGWEKMGGTSVQELTNNWAPYFSDGNIEDYNEAGTMPVYAQRQWYNMQSKVYNPTYYQPKYRFLIKERSEADIAKDVKTCSTFFKIASLNIGSEGELVWDDAGTIKTATDTNISRMVEVKMEDGILNSLTSQEQLDDDYKSHYTKSAEATYIYNSRLNMGDVTEEVNADANRCLVSMPTNYVGSTGGNYYYWKAEVELIKNGKSVFVREPAIDIITGYDADYPRYVFVPDADAKRVYLTRYLSKGGNPIGGLVPQAGVVPTAGEGETAPGESVIDDSQLGSDDIGSDNADNDYVGGDTIVDNVGGEEVTIVKDAEKVHPFIGDDDEGAIWSPVGSSDAFTGRQVGTYRIELEEHEFLNGAVWFKGYSNAELTKYSGTDHMADGKNYTERVNYRNKIYTSNADNPMKFQPENINTIGTGRILAMRSAVTPVRANQVGQLSMYAFSEDGVWSLKVSGTTGGWSGWEIVNGDVVSDSQSVCQLDNAVAYITAQGVKVIQGAESTCLSSILDGPQHGVDEVLRGLDDGAIDIILNGLERVGMKFEDYLVGARLAYDYTNQRLIVYNKNCNYYYIYNIASPGWGCAQMNIISAVNDYPKTWANCDNRLGYVAELTAKHNDETTLCAYFCSRAIKLDSPDVLKTITDLILRHNTDMYQINTVMLFGSRDLLNWQLVSHSQYRVRAKHGSGYKYFKLLVEGDFSSWSKIDGFTAEVSAKFTNKLR